MIRKFIDYVKIKLNKNIKPNIIARKNHAVSRNAISKNALKVLYRLHNNGYQAYLVGGGIRDILIEMVPKDFDVVTNARPEEIKKIFSNCRLIGRRFKLAHIHFGRDIIEVATFRKSPKNAGTILERDNTFGTLDEDVKRRDFTINAVYYNIKDYSLVDYYNSIEDIKNKNIKIIGDPDIRFEEDPVRMLRAIRFAAKLDFTIEEKTQNSILKNYKLLESVSEARLFEEYIKLFLSGSALKTYQMLQKFNLFYFLFPESEKLVKVNIKLIEQALLNTDNRVNANKSISPAFLIAVFLWQSFKDTENVTDVFKTQRKHVSVPKKLAYMIQDIWFMQDRFKKRTARRTMELFSHPKFRAAYDFLELRALSGEKEIIEIYKWWEQYIAVDQKTRWKMVKALESKNKRNKRTK